MRDWSTREEIAAYERQRSLEDAMQALKDAGEAARARMNAELTAQDVLARVLGATRDGAHRMFGQNRQTHDTRTGVHANERYSEYDLGVPYEGPRGASNATTLMVSRTLSSHGAGEGVDFSDGNRIDEVTVFAPDTSDDQRLPVMYGLRGTYVATFKLDHQAGVITADLPGQAKGVTVVSSPAALEAVSSLVADLDAAPQREFDTSAPLPHARAI